MSAAPILTDENFSYIQEIVSAFTFTNQWK
jgi:hypothetical protein